MWVRTTALLSDENDKLHKLFDVRLPKAPLETVVMEVNNEVSLQRFIGNARKQESVTKSQHLLPALHRTGLRHT